MGRQPIALHWGPIVLPAVPHPGVLEMSPAGEQQIINSLAAISEDIKTLVGLVKELTTQQDAADQKAYMQLVNIAHRR